jgi:hypothetical protein
VKCAAIGHEIAHRVLQDLARPVDAVELFMRCFQEQVSQLIGIEHTAIE